MDNLLLTAEPFLTGRPLEIWLDSMGIKDWSINADGLVDVKGDVDLERKLWNLKRLPVRFGQVDGNFLCSCGQLVSLEGAPKVLVGHFSCSENQLVSLEGAPKEVGGSLYCQYNRLASLEGAPKEVGGGFWCDHNLLGDFKGMECVSVGVRLVVTARHSAGQDNVFVSLEGLPKALYSKVEGLDIPFVLELDKKRATNLLGYEVEELISEVELG